VTDYIRIILADWLESLARVIRPRAGGGKGEE